MATANGNAGQNLAQANAAARNFILSRALSVTQNIYSATIANPGNAGGNVLNIQPRNVGMIKSFDVEITATLTNTGTTLASATNFNVGNLLSQIVYNDLNNLTRIQTTGWHMTILDTVRFPKGGPYGSALVYSTGHDSPIKFGSNYAGGLWVAPATIGPSSTAIVKSVFRIPLAYDDNDLRGAVYSNVVNATQLLQLTLNPFPIVASTADPNLAIYAGVGAGGSIVSATVNVYQNFLDQIPVGKNGPILPLQDLSTVYELKNTSLTGMVQNQDFPIPYSNFRDFLSTSIIWDNSPGGQAAVAGTDINYWALQAANFTNIFKVDPFLASLEVRKRISVDLPVSSYYFDHRKRPISTIQYGNLELILNASAAVNNGAQALVGFESFGLINSITGAGSLAAG